MNHSKPTGRVIRGLLLVSLAIGGLSAATGSSAAATARYAGATHGRGPVQGSVAGAGWHRLPAGLALALRRALGPQALDGRPSLPEPATTWSQQAEITATDGAKRDEFGISVALSGTTALVGAFQKNNNTGAAYVFVQSGSTWTQQAEITATDGATFDQFGTSVALSGDTALVGAPDRTIGANIHQGAAYVFVQSGSTWTQQAEITATDGAAFDQFGTSVALSGDTALVGAFQKNNDTGAAYVFGRSGSTWSQQQEITASDSASGDSFGLSVALSGNTALVGAPGKNSQTGAAYVFVRSGTTWSQQAEFSAKDGAVRDNFGWSVALSGSTALVGAPGKNSNTGAAYVFVRSGTTWRQQAKLTASDAAILDQFGYRVALAGSTALVGAPRKAIGGNRAQGAAYVFVRNCFHGVICTWTQQAELTASDGTQGDDFGGAVALSGSTALVGAWSKKIGTNGGQGAAYVFVRT